MKKSIAMGLLVLALIGLTGCDNTLSRSFGGTMNLKLEPNQKLVMITWKDSELWYLTRPMKENEEAEELVFQEKNEIGIMEGTVIITETESR